MTRVPLLVAALGIAQIISWGTLFYAIGVLGRPMREELGASELFTFSAFTAGLLLSGVLSPWVGRLIDSRGGGVVLSAGSVIGAAAMTLIAFSTHPAMMAAGWVVAGAAMSACLYDPAFATLSQLTGPRYRQAVTALTLFGGFASTVFWPLSQFLLETVGWRHACLIYVALHLFVCLPIHSLIVARMPRVTVDPVARPKDAVHATARLRWLAAAFALASFVFTIMTVHIVELLTSAGLTAKQAVALSVLFGPMQVFGRIVEMSLSRRVRAVSSGFFSFGVMVIALLALMAVDGFGAVPVIFVVACGVGNGVLTIARGTVPAELFGAHGLGAILGRLSLSALLARAVAPASFSALLAAGLTRNQSLALLVAVGLGGGAC